MTLVNDIERYVAYKRAMGLKYDKEAALLYSFGGFAAAQCEQYIRIETAVQWAYQASSVRQQRNRVLTVRKLAVWLQAEDDRHEIPHPDAAGTVSLYRRPTPVLLSTDEIRDVMNAALRMKPSDSINRYTYYYALGVIATTGLRVSEALSLELADITPDGLVIRQTKFKKSRLVVLHPSTHDALKRYLRIRNRYGISCDRLFVLSGAVPLKGDCLGKTYRTLLRQLGLRGGPGQGGTRLHDLRHAFATRSIEQACNADFDSVSRHMLALSTYLGHAEISSTYWYLEATPALLSQIADQTQQNTELKL